jgi:hypothetical protein
MLVLYRKFLRQRSIVHTWLWEATWVTGWP